MDAALEHLRENGVLGGLNLKEVADRAEVTPANIYHYFGSRQGLLRAALNRELDRLSSLVEAVGDLDLADRRLAMFDAIVARPEIRLTALLALDDDPGYEPLPFAATTTARYAEEQAAGDHPADLDLIALHLVSLATSAGIAIYADAAARQLGIERDEIVRRARAVLATMLDGLEP